VQPSNDRNDALTDARDNSARESSPADAAWLPRAAHGSVPAMPGGAEPTLLSRASQARFERLARVAWRACVVLAVVHAVYFVVVALLRLPFPYEVDWMEGGQLLESREILAGRFPYAAPSADHIAMPYQPLYAAVVAALGSLFGLSLPLARGVSIVATFAGAWFVCAAVRRETRSLRAGLLAAATFLGMYSITSFWFDKARVDSLFLSLLVGGLYCAKAIERPWRALALSALLLVLAYKTKQLALPFFVLVPPLLYPKSKSAALAFAPLVGATLLGDFVWSQHVSGGWFSFFVNTVPRGQPYYADEVFRFFVVVFTSVPLLCGLAIAGGDRGLRRGPWLARLQQTWPLATLIGIVVSLLAWARPGGASNNLLTTHVFLIIVAVIELQRRESEGNARLRAFLFSAYALQLLGLLHSPLDQIPRSEHYRAQQRRVEMLRAAPGPVLVPNRPWLAVLAGKAPSYHAAEYWELAFQHRDDLMPPPDLRRRIRTGYYALIAVESDPRRLRVLDYWWPPEMLASYRCDTPFDLAGPSASVGEAKFNDAHLLCTYVGAGVASP
jgi:hypothetical protein